MVVGKAHEHHIGKALHLVAFLFIAALQNTALVTPVSFYALSVQFYVLVSHHVIENQEIGFTKSKGSKSGMETG